MDRPADHPQDRPQGHRLIRGNSADEVAPDPPPPITPAPWPNRCSPRPTLSRSSPAPPTPRALVLLRAHILIALESQVGVEHWRKPTDLSQFYLRAIEAQGYTLADIERRAAGLRPPLDEQ